MSDAELHALFDRLFPGGFAGQDVLDELAPRGWERSPLVACFHPSVERIFEERLAMHRNLNELRRLHRGRSSGTTEIFSPEPTFAEVKTDYAPSVIQRDEEVTELVGLCLWDIFSDNHEVVLPDGCLADIGSFRGAGAFIDEHLTREQEHWREGDYLRFYMGTIWIGRRADLTPVYAMIFARLKDLGADWIYHFPELQLVELTAADHEPMDREPPATVRAYRQVYGRDPRGWPPVPHRVM